MAQAEKTTQTILSQSLWSDIGQWNQKPLPSSFWVNYHQSAISAQLSLDYQIKPFFIIHGHFWYQKQDYTAVLNEVITRYQDGTLVKLNKSFDTVGREITERYAAAKTTNLFATQSLHDLFTLHQDLVAFWWIKTVIGEVMTQAALQSRLIKSESDFFELVHPHLRKTWIEEEEASAKAMAMYFLQRNVFSITESELNEAAMADPMLSAMTEKYMKDFEWVGVNKWEGEPNSFAKLASRLSEAITNLKQGNYVESKHLGSRPFSELDPLIQLAVVTAYWRPVCGGLAAQFEFHMRERLQRLGQQHDLSYDDCLHFTQHELVQLEEQGQLPISRDVIKSRHEGFAIFVADEEVVVVSGRDELYSRMRDMYVKVVSASTKKTFKGVSASRGFVTGRANIVTRQADFAKFNQGDILVTPETTPAFVPLMRKAAAIITERGGITSHAAIVSRELKVPCVISAVGLMSSVRDGDMLEVNADNGIITILN